MRGTSHATAVVAYNGVDGACAAAMLLQRSPQAQVYVTSAGRIDETLGAIAGEKTAFREVHICGVGADCTRESLRTAAEKLRKKRTEIVWHCGRGYLDDRRDEFSEFCRCSFIQAGSNTAAVAQATGIAPGDPIPSLLLALAKLDPHIAEAKSPARGDLAGWLDLIQASISQYFKFQDADHFPQTIRHLAAGKMTGEDERLIVVFRGSGSRYMMEGKSAAIRELRQLLKKIAKVNEPVIITGETGTGKEHAAHLIHEASHRADRPFVAINCAIFAGNSALANSSLFGHAKGAFTGATADRKGSFSTADKGILFLDELAHLPIEIQAKLLRVVEDGLIMAEGADQPAKVDVRLVVGTNRDLPELIRRGEFLPDLYHRLSALPLRIPPLRERIEDIPPLVAKTLASLGAEGHPLSIQRGDMKRLEAYSWPGNVRQLIKLVRRAAHLDLPIAEALAKEEALGGLEEDRNAAECPIWPQTGEQVLPMERVKAIYARRALNLLGGNKAATLRALELKHPQTLNKLLDGQE